MKWFLADFAASPAVLNRLFCFATPAVTPAEPAASPAAPAASPASPAAGAPPDASPTSAPSPNDANIRALRETHEFVSKLGSRDEVQAAVQGYRQIATQAQQLGESLGYTPDSVKMALAKDPIGTLIRLQQEQAQGQPAGNEPPDPNELIQRELAPIKEQFARQQATAATGRYDAAFNDLFSNHPEFKGAGEIPKEIRDVIYDMTSEAFKYDQEGMGRLLREGKTSDIQKYFDGTMERFLKTVNVYSQWKSGRSGNAPAPAARAPQPKLSLDDIINGTQKAEAAMPSLRRGA